MQVKLDWLMSPLDSPGDVMSAGVYWIRMDQEPGGIFQFNITVYVF